LLVHGAPLLLEPVDDAALLTVSDHVGPPQLPDEEEQHEHARGEQQLAHDAERSRARAGARTATGRCVVAGGGAAAVGRAHRAVAASRVREPLKAGRVAVSRVSTFSPRPTCPTHSRLTCTPGASSRAAVISSIGPMTVMTTGGE